MRKGAAGILMPIFTLAMIVLMILIAGQFFRGLTSVDQSPRIGLIQHEVMNEHLRLQMKQSYAIRITEQALENTQSIQSTQELIPHVRQAVQQGLIGLPRPIRQQVTVGANTTHITVSIPYESHIGIRTSQYATGQSVHTTGSGVFSIWPVRNPVYITSLFGSRIVRSGSTNHAGIDIRAAVGDEVLSVEQGVVSLVGRNFVEVRKEQYTCRYYHVQPRVQQGESVRQGDVIAHIKQDGSFAPHLDFRCFDHISPHLFTQQELQPYFTTSQSQERRPVLGIEFAGNVYIDAYCLFHDTIREQARAALDTDLSGLAFKPGNTARERLDWTCEEYARRGLLPEITVTDAFLEMLLELTIQHEGTTCVDDPLDRGGVTMYGITITTLSDWRGRTVTPDEVCALTRDEANRIYLENYLFRPRINELPIELIPHTFDIGVNSGVNRAVRWIYELLVQNGYSLQPNENAPLRQETIDATHHAISQGIPLSKQLFERREQFYHQIVANNETQRRFLRGWLNRLETYRDPLPFPVQQRQAGTTNTLIEFSVPLNQQFRDALQERRDIIHTMQQFCTYTDVRCQEQLGNGFISCQDYLFELAHSIQQCNLASGCSCRIPVPIQDTIFHPAEIQQGGVQSYIPWPFQSVTYRMAFAQQGGDIAVGQIFFENATQTLNMPQQQVMQGIPVQEYIWIRAQEGIISEQGEEQFIIYFSAENHTGACQQEMLKTFCREEEQIRVQLRT